MSSTAQEYSPLMSRIHHYLSSELGILANAHISSKRAMAW